MGDKEDYLTSYRVFFENFAANVNPEDQLPVNIAGYTITESELAGEVLYWTTQYLSEKQCPLTLMTPLRRIILDEVRVASKKHPNEFGYKSDEAVYIALRLMQAVTARVNDVCLRYLDNSRLDSLPPPPPLAQRDLKTVSCATKNSRRSMEDRHIEIGNLEALFGVDTTEPTSFYAVYDGHAGSAAATYCAAHLHQYLVESAHFGADLRRALRDAFLRTDAEFIRKGNQDRVCGGSTAVTVCVRGRRLLAAWAGDSLALLAKRMRLMQLVRPHKPGRQDERDRIESSGGTVMYWGTWRVNGQLAVSRAIGDAQYKPYVTARPEIATVDLDGDEDFVVVACDGLWDFVSEDDVALSVYRQLAADPDDLKAVTKRLILQAKRQGSADNISIIVVFLKDPRDIVADNCPPMDLGLDNAMVNAPPFTIDTDACRRQVDAAVAATDNESAECADADADAEAADNGVDNSDSDSEDLGPETAVDADDVDTERNHVPQPPTPPAHTVVGSAGHVDGALADNVGESGDESEDEWNYIKGERDEHAPSDADDAPRSETPCQDNSAWESSSVDMNSSPLNPEAPVFVPGVAGDVVLAESPRKPVPMDDLELPDVAQFRSGAGIRPAELLDLDNCDHLNGHHNVSAEEVKEEHLNGNDKCAMDSLGFGFNVGIEPDKVKDTALIQDFDRIQKDTTDFCDIQVFQTNAETNPFAIEGNDELFERLKNKERDPMSMSFYQEKDDDTCERLSSKDSHVDLNAVQLLPDSDDEELQTNGVCEDVKDSDKENISPHQHTDLFGGETDSHEPNNDIIRFDDRPTDIPQNINNFDQGDNFVDYNTNSNMDSFNIEFGANNIPQDTVLQTDTPESHKLLFEQIPEIPDGKSSELGFTNDEVQDPSESEKETRPFTPQDETSQDVEMESKQDDSPLEAQPELPTDQSTELHQCSTPSEPADIERAHSTELPISPAPENLSQDSEPEKIDAMKETSELPSEHIDNAPIYDDFVHDLETRAESSEPPVIKLDTEHLTQDSEIDKESPLPAEPTESPAPKSPVPSETQLPSESPVPAQSPLLAEALPTESPVPAKSPIPAETLLPSESPVPTHSPLPSETLLPAESPVPAQSPLPVDTLLPSESPAPAQSLPTESPIPHSPLPTEELVRDSPLPAELSLPAESLVSAASPLPTVPVLESPLPVESPVPAESMETFQPAKSPVPSEPSPLRDEPAESVPKDDELLVQEEAQIVGSSPLPVPSESPAPVESDPTESLQSKSPLPTGDLPVDTELPRPADVPLPRESPVPAESPLQDELLANEPAQEVLSPAPVEELIAAETVSTEDSAPATIPEAVRTSLPASPLPTEQITGSIVEESERLVLPSSGASAPAPDLLPESAPRCELVTDVDIGIPESRAQEICLPVTSEIQHDEDAQPAATPPPTPAVDAPAPSLDAPAALVDTPIAADATAPAELSESAPVPVAELAVAAAAATAAGAVVAITKSATKTTTKKSPSTPTAKPDARTPKSAPKPTAARTPASATTKRPAPTTPAAKTPITAKSTIPAKTPVSAKAPTTKPATPTARPAPKPAAPAAKPATATAKPAGLAKALARPAPKSNGVAPKPKEAPATARPAPITRAAPRPAPKAPASARPAAPKPEAAAKPAPARPAPRPAPITRPAAKPAAPKPLTNGDVKEAKAPAPITRPAPRAAPLARPAPRPAPRATPAPPTAKPLAPKSAPARAPLDKQSKDLANKRITAKAAPPRTAPAKTTTLGTKKPVPKKSIESPKQQAVGNGLPNGAPAPAPVPVGKAPPSPPADAALLPDVIA